MKKFLNISLILILILTFSSSLYAGDYPNRKIEFVVGFGAGGGTDTAARMLAEPLQDKVNKPVVVVNKTGANGANAENYVQNQPADGYTVFFANNSAAQNLALDAVDHELKDWQPVMRAQFDVGTITVLENGKFNTIDEFVKYAKENPNKAKIGVVSTGNQVIVEQFAKEAGIEVNCIVYSEQGKLPKDLMGNNLDAIHAEMAEVEGLIESGIMKPIVFLKNGKRVEDYPDVPVTEEKGWNVNLGVFRGVMVKKGTPIEIVDFLRESFSKAMETEKYKEFEKSNMLNIVDGYMNTNEFNEYFTNMVEVYSEFNYLFE